MHDLTATMFVDTGAFSIVAKGGSRDWCVRRPRMSRFFLCPNVDEGVETPTIARESTKGVHVSEKLSLCTFWISIMNTC